MDAIDIERRIGLPFSLHRSLSRLKSDLAVGTVTEGLVHRSAATAERKRGLTSEVVLGSIGVDQLHHSVGIFYAKRAVGTNCDLHLRHGASMENVRFKPNIPEHARAGSL
jgi:hypothetical protein